MGGRHVLGDDVDAAKVGEQPGNELDFNASSPPPTPRYPPRPGSLSSLISTAILLMVIESIRMIDLIRMRNPPTPKEG